MWFPKTRITCESPSLKLRHALCLDLLIPTLHRRRGTLCNSSPSTGWVDPDNDGGGFYYKVTSTDFSGNESDAAGATTTTSVPERATPTTFALHQNVSNPFNPSTTIQFDVPASGGVVTLRIYDVSGRLVRTLINESQSVGQKSVSWNGRNDAGQQVATGTYFYRLVAPGFEQTRKMVLLK